ncbi:MAG: glycoside hydrolase family 97 protein [Bacteroidales bacterium]|nr:glycoside hydrolase family 97 protein [Bacteroidales bacterium]
MRNSVRVLSILVSLLLSCVYSQAATKKHTLTSPNGKLTAVVESGENLQWTLSYDGQQLIAPSAISMTLADGTVYGGAAKVSREIRRSVDRIINAHIYKKAQVQDKYNELTLKFKNYSLIFRAFDDGFAYRFVSHSKVPFKVVSEQATFAVPEDWNMYVGYVCQNLATLETQLFNSHENIYEYCPVSQWNKERLAFTPLMIEAPKGLKMCIMEADLLNYPGMFLYNDDASSTLDGVFARYPKTMEQGGHNMLQMLVKDREEYIAAFDGATEFPWRAISISENDAQMADNDLVYRLAKDPDPQKDWSWVKPGKVAWDWWNAWNIRGVDFRAGINNDTYKYYIDFASEYGIEYVILDEGWAVNKKADLFQVIPEIDLEMLVKYAQERNVGLILWAGYWAFDREMEKVFQHFSKMGIKGFKVDFMDRDDQIMVDFHHRASKMAADYGMLIDFHGTYKPTGLHRTYPNVVNFEGVHGLETAKGSRGKEDEVEYDVTIPFIRMAAGPMDYTQGAMRNATKRNFRSVSSEAMSQGTRCRQLAEYVIFESPLNMLCDNPCNYMDEPECTRFIAAIPTVWEETKALDGKVADYIVMARRSGNTWYVGGLTDWTPRDLQVNLDFLADGEYEVELFRDGVNADRTARDYKKVMMTIAVKDGKAEPMNIHLAPGGGFAAKITKK